MGFFTFFKILFPVKKLFNVILLFFACAALQAQTGTISGVVRDNGTGETLIGATVIYAPGKGTTTDIDGKYTLTIPHGEYTLNVSYLNYEDKNTPIVIEKSYSNLDFNLVSKTLREIEVVADLAVARETPVAFSNITSLQITKELGVSDLPLLLNTTPGVYVSPTGGGDGGPRVSIRGFQDRNITVMIDGIPINNMDNGNVFWANTFGLDAVLANMQVQRGMTSSRLAIPAIGGTINYITKSIENKPSFFVRQDAGTFSTLRTTLGYNSGRLKNGWGFSAAGAFRKSDGYAVEQFKEEYFYSFKVQKEIGKHIVSFSAMGSPVKYGVRQDRQKIAVYDKEYARGLFKGNEELYNRLSNYSVADNQGRGNVTTFAPRDSLGELYGWTLQDYRDIASENDFIDTTGVISKGFRYNNHWGHLNGSVLNERVRDYHKPIFTLRDFWNISDKVYLSNVVYYSSGRGGGTSRVPSLGFGDYDDELQVDFQDDYTNNTQDGILGPINPAGFPGQRKSSVILNKAFDNHYWFGLLSTLDYRINDTWTFAGGLDFRTYESQQYTEVHNLLGGDYFIPSNEELPEDRPPTTPGNVFRQGDRYNYNNDNLMRWAAAFAELKYKKESWTGFINISGVSTGYKRIDYFNNRDFILDGERFPNAIGYGDVLFYNGTDILVAAGTPGGSPATITQSGDTTFVINPNNNLNEYAPAGNHYIVGARQVNYGDSETQVSTTPWKNIPGYSAKGGVSYALNEFNSVFTNIGYISRTPRFRNVVDLGVLNQFMRDIRNENIASVEIGYGYSRNKFAINVNAYYTDWKNRPTNTPNRVFLPDRGISVRVNLNDMDAVHQGVELNFTYLLSKKVTLEGFVSLGDWRWASAKVVNFFDDQGRPIYHYQNGQLTDSLVTIDFDAKGVFVGDAPQTQIGGALNYNITENAYIKTRFTYFDRHYASFDPLQLQDLGPGKNRKGQQSWKMPAYGLVSIFGGYRFDFNKVQMDVNLIVDNLLNVRYIADGTNNSGTSLVTVDYLNSQPLATVTSDANSTAVYFGLPRTFGVSLKLTL